MDVTRIKVRFLATSFAFNFNFILMRNKLLHDKLAANGKKSVTKPQIVVYSNTAWFPTLLGFVGFAAYQY